ncbi:MAG: hypothetical protein ACKVUS_03335 [Saprospiraceae bacterium]
MRILSTLALALAFFSACSQSKNHPAPGSNYPNNVGDITPDPLLDDSTFRACRESNIPQYYSLDVAGFDGEKPAIERYFKQNFKTEKGWAKENGYVTIRFVVNCNGLTGRFRVMEMGQDYLAKKFPPTLSDHLLQLCKQMKGWLPGKSESIPYDYYQYLTFTIANGEIARITP